MSSDTPKRIETCPGCGLAVPELDTEPDLRHRHVGAAPGCWSLYTQVLAQVYANLGNPPWHVLVADAYGAQHPGQSTTQGVQAVWLHLIGLCLVLERKVAPARAMRLKQRILATDPTLAWLTPPEHSGPQTVRDMLAALEKTDAEAVERAAVTWAASVWAAWEHHHGAIRELLDKLGAVLEF